MAGSLDTTAASQSTSLQRLHHVEKRIVHTMELAGGVMEELANGAGSRTSDVATQCREFMQSVKDIQVTLRDEIKGICEYRPYENCDYVARTAAELSVRKLESLIGQTEEMHEVVKQYRDMSSKTV
eukprot:c22295_g1_i1 orf=64-441(+)